MLQNGELFQADSISKRVGFELPGVFIPASMRLTSLVVARFSETIFGCHSFAIICGGLEICPKLGRVTQFRIESECISISI